MANERSLRAKIRTFWHNIPASRGGGAEQVSPSESIQARHSMAESIDTPVRGEIIREGARVRLRRHVPANREAFQRWYADPEIATLLRHDLRPLNERQSRGYFDTLILPMSARGLAFAIHDKATDTLIGTTALTETDDYAPHARLFRIAIGEKRWWDKGMGSEATALVLDEAFETLKLAEVRLEVFAHNPRAIAVYERVGFRRTGEHLEHIGSDRPLLHVFEMAISRDAWIRQYDASDETPSPV